MKKDSKALHFLYNNWFGIMILKFIYNHWFSKLMGLLLSTKISALIIDGFIKKHNINMSRFQKKRYKSFNDFFIRELKDNSVVQDTDVFISPSDGNLLVYEINETSQFNIKNATYSIADLLGEEEDRYNGGYCLIYRLEATDYHRYCYIDRGTKEDNIYIKGVLHTVQEIATDKYKIFHTNSREWTKMKTDNFGTITQIEVGALVVGKIDNYHESHGFTRGEEKGRFEFGGSTIIMLIEKDKVKIDDKFIHSGRDNVESHVLYGTEIGQKI